MNHESSAVIYAPVHPAGPVSPRVFRKVVGAYYRYSPLYR